MAEPVWVDRLVVDAVHAQQLREHGGLHGVRDENASESALARPRNKWAHDPQSDLATLAAAYGYGLVTNHPYRDGNKRVAFLTMVIFLGLNRRDLEVPEDEVVTVMLGVAARRCSGKTLARWVKTHTVRLR